MDIREIQRLHEQFAHAPLTLEAPSSSQHPFTRLLPPPAAYAAAGATRRWIGRAGSARLIVTVVVGVVAAGALGMSLATWQHGRATTAAKSASAEPTAAAATAATPPVVVPTSAPVAAAAVESASVPAKSQPVGPTVNLTEPERPTVPPAAPVAAPERRPQPSPAQATRAAAPVNRKAELAPPARKADPAPATAMATQASPAARRADSAAEIKLF